MKIKQVRIINYKGFADSLAIPLGERATVIVGQNNAGKTALLEALSVLDNKPYRGPKDGDGFFPVQDPQSRVQIDLVTSGKEVTRRFLQRGAQLVFLSPVVDSTQNEAVLSDIFSRDNLEWRFEVGAEWIARDNPAQQPLSGRPQYRAATTPSPDRRSWSTPAYIGTGGSEGWVDLLREIYKSSFFIFRAERLNIGKSGIDNSAVLNPDASNLPSALLQLQGQSEAHEKYIKLIRQIFPNVLGVASKPITGNQASIFVTSRDSNAPAKSGIELQLNDCGTGISQVLAILYVVVTAEFPKIIVIDEPNSFLHPGAVRKLLGILKQFDHQYIVSTHSADIIGALEPDVVSLVSWQNNQSKVHTLDRSKAEDQRRLLEELGVRLSDVFGADNLLWVEGQTEERCFPMLLRDLGLFSPGMVVRALVATGDLEVRGARADLIYQVYERLSAGSALVPPAIAISLDREDRTANEMTDLIKRSGGLVKFLPRYAYENYLIHENAIAAIINENLVAEDQVSIDAVSSWIADHHLDPKFFRAKVDGGAWRKLIDAPQFLSRLFVEVTQAKLEFRKTHHSPKLTSWLLENARSQFSELFDYLKSLIEA